MMKNGLCRPIVDPDDRSRPTTGLQFERSVQRTALAGVSLCRCRQALRRYDNAFWKSLLGGNSRRSKEENSNQGGPRSTLIEPRTYYNLIHAHSQKEPRYYVLGHTIAGRRLFIAFTIRGDKIRVISARDMSKKERSIYEQINS
jgi:uncharacterized DUF497 family protein